MANGCSKCGTQNADDAKVCRGCGAALTVGSTDTLAAPPDVRCHACGTFIPASARFCTQCGADQSQVTTSPLFQPTQTSDSAFAPSAFLHTPPPPTAKPMGLWISLGVLAVALIAGGAWWFKSTRANGAGASDTAAAPAPVAAPATDVASNPITAPEPASTPTAQPAAAPASEPASLATPTAAAVEGPASAAAVIETDAASAAALAKEKDRIARETRTKALREQRAQAASQAAARAAEQEAARRRAEEAGARAAPAPPPPAAPAPVAPPQPRTAQEICAGGNVIVRGICEARECVRNEHADEALCKRLRAADDRRRQQD